MANVIKLEKHDFSDVKNAILPFNVLADTYGEALAAEQLMLEYESYQLGEERFKKNLERQVEYGEFSDNITVQPMIDTLVINLAERINEFVTVKKRGKPHVTKPIFSQLKTHNAAYIIIKCVLNVLAKEESVPVQRLAISIGGQIEDEIRYGRIREEEIEIYKSRIKSNVDKRQGYAYKKAYLQATEAGMVEAGDLKSEHIKFTKSSLVHIGVRSLEMLIESTGMVELERKFAGDPKNDHEAIHLAGEYIKKFTSRAHALAGISPMYQPMVVKPKRWTGIRGGGYHAKGRRPLNFIRVGSRKALERYLQVDMPQVYEAVNLIQETAWRVNTDVLAVANRIVTWNNCPVEDVPSMEPEELPVKPEDIDTNEAALKDWKRKAAAIYRREKARQSRRISLEFMLEQANKFAKYNVIYFPHNLDWRGRVYAVPMFSPQGNDLTKGLLTFADKVALGDNGAYWLAIHGANCAGVDKVSLNDRVKWVEENETNIIASAENPLDCTWWTEQDSPFCFLAFCFEWNAYVKSGRSNDFESSLPLAFDGTCSGLQHYSAILRDEVGGRAVNLIPSDKPQDIYGIVATRVNELLKDYLQDGSEDEVVVYEDKKTGEISERLQLGERTLAAQWLEFGVTRNVTKRSVMTLPYGSKEYGFGEQVLVDTVKPAIDSGKGAMFTNAGQASRFMAKLIWKAVNETVVSAVEAMEWLQQTAKIVTAEIKDKKTKEIYKEESPIHWTTPNGFPVWSEYRKYEQIRIDCVILGSKRLQMTVNTDVQTGIDVNKQVSGIAPNFIHSMDASHLQLTVLKCNYAYGIKSFAMIHDSFGCHAGKAEFMFKGVRETMYETYSTYDVLKDFYDEAAKVIPDEFLELIPKLPSKGTLTLSDVLKSLYTFS